MSPGHTDTPVHHNILFWSVHHDQHNIHYCAFSVLVQTGDINNALGDACEAGSVGMVIVLLDLGADVNYRNEVK
jgi:hypothetical protein